MQQRSFLLFLHSLFTPQPFPNSQSLTQPVSRLTTWAQAPLLSHRTQQSINPLVSQWRIARHEFNWTHLDDVWSTMIHVVHNAYLTCTWNQHNICFYVSFYSDVHIHMYVSYNFNSTNNNLIIDSFHFWILFTLNHWW